MTTSFADGRVGTVLHAADLHLGAPLKALGSRLDAHVTAHIRQLATRAFDNLVELAIAEAVDVVVLAGDVYDDAQYEVAAQLRFVKGLNRMTEAGIRVFIAHGNHDPLQKNFRLAAKMPDGVTVFEPGSPQPHHVSLGGNHDLYVAGVSFGKQAETANLARLFHDLDTPAESTVGVLHCNVGSNPGHDPYAPCTVADLENAPVGYWALGHIHMRDVKPLGPGRWWAYPGNLQGRSSKAAECGGKGVLLVPVLRNGFGQPEFRPCAKVRFERVPVDVSGCDDVEDLADESADAETTASGDDVADEPVTDPVADVEDLTDESADADTMASGDDVTDEPVSDPVADVEDLADESADADTTASGDDVTDEPADADTTTSGDDVVADEPVGDPIADPEDLADEPADAETTASGDDDLADGPVSDPVADVEDLADELVTDPAAVVDDLADNGTTPGPPSGPPPVRTVGPPSRARAARTAVLIAMIATPMWFARETVIEVVTAILAMGLLIGLVFVLVVSAEARRVVAVVLGLCLTLVFHTVRVSALLLVAILGLFVRRR